MRNAFAAWVYRSAAFSYFSDLPPKKLNPPPAPAAALSAWNCMVSQDARQHGGVVFVPFAVMHEDLAPCSGAKVTTKKGICSGI